MKYFLVLLERCPIFRQYYGTVCTKKTMVFAFGGFIVGFRFCKRCLFCILQKLYFVICLAMLYLGLFLSCYFSVEGIHGI